MQEELQEEGEGVSDVEGVDGVEGIEGGDEWEEEDDEEKYWEDTDGVCEYLLCSGYLAPREGSLKDIRPTDILLAGVVPLSLSFFFFFFFFLTTAVAFLLTLKKHISHFKYIIFMYSFQYIYEYTKNSRRDPFSVDSIAQLHWALNWFRRVLTAESF